MEEALILLSITSFSISLLYLITKAFEKHSRKLQKKKDTVFQNIVGATAILPARRWLEEPEILSSVSCDKSFLIILLRLFCINRGQRRSPFLRISSFFYGSLCDRRFIKSLTQPTIPNGPTKPLLLRLTVKVLLSFFGSQIFMKEIKVVSFRKFQQKPNIQSFLTMRGVYILNSSPSMNQNELLQRKSFDLEVF